MGLSPQSGHDRAFAVHCNASSQVSAAHESLSVPSWAPESDWRQFDDGVRGVRGKPDDISDIESNCYNHAG